MFSVPPLMDVMPGGRWPYFAGSASGETSLAADSLARCGKICLRRRKILVAKSLEKSDELTTTMGSVKIRYIIERLERCIRITYLGRAQWRQPDTVVGNYRWGGRNRWREQKEGSSLLQGHREATIAD